MTTNLSQLSNVFQKSTETAQLLSAYKELLEDRESAEKLIETKLDEFAASPEKLSEESLRKELSHVLLLAGMLQDERAYGRMVALVTSPKFCETVPKQEWLFCELSRLLGSLSPADGLEDIVKMTLSADVHQNLREQLVMAILYRWFAERDRDSVFSAAIGTLMERLTAGTVNYELGMALIVNAIAATGDSCRDAVFAFFHKHSDAFAGKMSDKAIGNFFVLGRQRTRSMLRANYMGGYGTPEHEIERMLNFAAESAEEEAQTAPKTLPPIVRDKPKIGRNDPCPCGSGKKYKHCCGR